MGRFAMTDTELIEASRAGDVDAFSALVKRYKALVCAVSYAATGDRALSEDVAQDTFVAAWRGLNDLRDVGAWRGWLCGIARNLGRKALRSAGREVPTDVEAKVALETLEQSPTPLSAALDKESEQLVWTALAGLPETYREPLVLFYREHKSASQVAEAMGLSEGAVHQRLTRGRQYLKQRVADAVETVIEQTRPSAGFAAAVIAAVTAAAAGTAQAASSTATPGTAKGLTMNTLLKLTAAAIVAAVVLASGSYWLVGKLSDDETAEASAGTGGDETNTGSAATTHRMHGDETAESSSGAAGKSGDDTASGAVRYSGAYELTIAAPTLAAVNLSGGESGIHTFDPPGPPPAFERIISGVARTSAGEPVAGAIVLIGPHISQRWGSLIASQGAITGDDGSFRVPVHSEQTLLAIAVHREVGWSSLGSVEAGDGDAELELVIAPPGSIAGTVSQLGQPVEAAIIVTSTTVPGLQLETKGETDGTFSFSLLPPGDYQVSVGLAQDIGGGSSRKVKQSIAIESNQTARPAIELPVGVLVAVQTSWPEDSETEMVEAIIVPGRHEVTGLDELEALVKSPEGKGYDRLLHGGADLENVIQFHDLDPGPVTVCSYTMKTVGESLAFGCKKLELRAGETVRELSFAFSN